MTISRITKREKGQRRQRKIFSLICIGLCFIVFCTFVLKRYLLSADADQNSLCNEDLLLIPPYTTKIPRATIVDRAGAVLAISQKKALVYAIPTQISNLVDTVKKLSNILDISQTKLLKLLSSSKNLCIIKDNLKLSIAKTISQLNISGIGISYYYTRIYPYKCLTDNIIGKIGPSGQGISGIEYTYNNLLTNKNCNNLVLTLDIDIESESQRLLKWQMARLRAGTGCFLLMNIKDGSLLAIASYQRHGWHFSPNKLALKANVSPVVIWPILNLLLRDKDKQDTAVYKNKAKSWYVLDINNEEMAFWAPFSPQISIANENNNKNIMSILASLGFGQKTGIDLPGEDAGFIMPISSCSLDPMIFTKVSALQLLVAFSKILVDSNNIVPHLAIHNHKIYSTRSGILFPRNRIDTLIKTISEGHGISLASIIFKRNSNSKLANSKNPAQVVALGFYPTKNPQVVYVLVLNSVKRDPRYIKGVLAQSYLIAQKANHSILAQKNIKKRLGSFWASIELDKDS